MVEEGMKAGGLAEEAMIQMNNMTDFSNGTKTSTTFTNQQFSANQTLEQSEGTFEDNEVAIEKGIAFENGVKNSTAFTNGTKN